MSGPRSWSRSTSPLDAVHRRRPEPAGRRQGGGHGLRRRAARRRSTSGLVSFAGNGDRAGARHDRPGRGARGIDRLELGPRTAIGEAICTSLDAVQRSTPVSAERAARRPGSSLVRRGEHGRADRGEAAGGGRGRGAGEHHRVRRPRDGSSTGVTVPVPVDAADPARGRRGDRGRRSRGEQESELRNVYEDIGSSVGYTTESRPRSPTGSSARRCSPCSPRSPRCAGSPACPDPARSAGWLDPGPVRRVARPGLVKPCDPTRPGPPAGVGPCPSRPAPPYAPPGGPPTRPVSRLGRAPEHPVGLSGCLIAHPVVHFSTQSTRLGAELHAPAR